MAWTAVFTFLVGGVVTAAQLNSYLSDNTDYLKTDLDTHVAAGPFSDHGVNPSVCAYHNAAQTIANATDTYLVFNSERWDNASMHSTSSNTGRLVAPVAGKYLVTARILWAASNTAYHRIQFYTNRTDNWHTEVKMNPTTDESGGTMVSAVDDLALNDYMEVRVYHKHGGNLDVGAYSYFSMTRIA